jgi:hypothetical protein
LGIDSAGVFSGTVMGGAWRDCGGLWLIGVVSEEADSGATAGARGERRALSLAREGRALSGGEAVSDAGLGAVCVSTVAAGTLSAIVSAPARPFCFAHAANESASARAISGLMRSTR